MDFQLSALINSSKTLSMQKRCDSIMAMADKAAENGLKITVKDAEFIAEAEENAVAEQQRVEIGTGAAALITEKFIRDTLIKSSQTEEKVV